MMHPKPFRVVSADLTRSARHQSCTLRLDPTICAGADPSTVVLAHLDGWTPGAKGDDSHAVYACHDCHDTIDGRAHKAFARQYPALILDRMLRALSETHHRMIADGLLIVRGWEP